MPDLNISHLILLCFYLSLTLHRKYVPQYQQTRRELVPIYQIRALILIETFQPTSSHLIFTWNVPHRANVVRRIPVLHHLVNPSLAQYEIRYKNSDLMRQSAFTAKTLKIRRYCYIRMLHQWNTKWTCRIRNCSIRGVEQWSRGWGCIVLVIRLARWDIEPRGRVSTGCILPRTLQCLF